MEYERIQKPSSNHHHHHQGGGFSPSKLRAILLGVQKERKEAEGLDSGLTLRSDDSAVDDDDRGTSVSENCKDVDLVSSLPPHVSANKSADSDFVSFRVRPHEEDSCDSDSTSSSAFEFHKAASTERAPPRSPMMPPFSKPAPSKWDDAQKWISSPTSSRGNKAGSVMQPKRSSLGGYGSKSFGAKVVLEVTDGVDTKRIDQSQAKKDNGGHKAVNWAPEPFPVSGSGEKSSVFENPFADSGVNHSQHDSSTAVQSITSLIPPPSKVESVSMRDMGTEMTPIASQEPSRTGTPNRAATPTRSPTSSRPLSPARTAESSTKPEASHLFQDSEKELSEKELKIKTRREIMVLGQQLGKTSIAAWANKEAEESDATVPVDQPATSAAEARAAAWEDAEEAKYLARFKQEEIKIQAWENHQKAKTEAEMKKIEVEVERMRARAHERLMNKLAASRHKADQKRAAAEARRNQQAARTAQEAEYIRRTGRIPSTHSCWGLCS